MNIFAEKIVTVEVESMDKTMIKELQKDIRENIGKGQYELAKECYQRQLAEMFDEFNSYNPKFEEYARFLWKYCDKSVFSETIKQELFRIIHEQPLKMEDRYTLYMLAGNIERRHRNTRYAIYWYRLAKEIYKAGFVKSDRSIRLLDEAYKAVCKKVRKNSSKLYKK